MTGAMEIKELPSQSVLRIQARVEPERLEEFLEEAFTRLFPCLENLGEYPAGPPFMLFYDSVAHKGIDLEVCVPTSRMLQMPQEEFDIVPAEIPGGEFAATIHVGPSNKIGDAYRDLFVWLTGNGYRPVGPCREVHLACFDNHGEPPEDVTEILFPVRKASERWRDLDPLTQREGSWNQD